MAYSNGEILIEKNIKLPEYRYSCPWPFANMEIGDSFEVDVYTEYPASYIQSAASYWRHATGGTYQFTVRSTLLEKNGGCKEYRIRTWRIK